MPNIVKWPFLLLVFAMPFEAVDLGVMSGVLTPAKLSGYLFFVVYFSYHIAYSKPLPRLSPAIWCFLCYLSIYTLHRLFIPEEFAGWILPGLLTLAQLLATFWLASDLLEDEMLARHVLLTYSMASVILALTMILGITGTEHGGRGTALGMNPNSVASIMAIAAVVLIGLQLNTSFHHFMSQASLAVLTLPLLAGLVYTGTRGGLIAFLLGCLTYFFPHLRSKRRWAVIILAISSIAVVGYMAAGNVAVTQRWERAYYKGDMAGREQIAPAAVEMILERPLFGWQPGVFAYELGFRTGVAGKATDAHNLFLHLLLEVGLVGTMPFFVGVWLCVRAAWRARAGNLGLVPLAVLLTLLVNNLSGTGLLNKPFWLTLALCVGAESAVYNRSRIQSRVVSVYKLLRYGL